MVQFVKAVFYFGPLIFAFGFLFPLFSQSFAAMGADNFLGMPFQLVSLVLAGVLGFAAQLRGRWI